MGTEAGGPGERDPEADPLGMARAICLRLLTDRPRTRRQLAQALGTRRVPEAAAEAVLDRLTDVGLIDDAAFADAWVATRHRGRNLSRRALREELRRRGVEGAEVEAALVQVDDDDELAAARELVDRRRPTLAGLPEPVQLRRLVAVLGRRGYSPGLAQQVVREAFRDASVPDPAPEAVGSRASSAVTRQRAAPQGGRLTVGDLRA
jgi:regulatory protein